MPTRCGAFRLISSSVTLICMAAFVQLANAQGPQVPIPQTAAEVAGPALGPMTPASVQMVGRMAYVWGWPLVYVYNQRAALTKVPEPVILNSVPLAPMNQVAMLTNYVSPGETSIADPNQDVVYGLGYLSLVRLKVLSRVSRQRLSPHGTPLSSIGSR